MPLDKSGSKASIGKNIEIEKSAGKPQKQAVAVALNTARTAGLKIKKSKVSNKTLRKGYKKI